MVVVIMIIKAEFSVASLPALGSQAATPDLKHELSRSQTLNNAEPRPPAPERLSGSVTPPPISPNPVRHVNKQASDDSSIRLFFTDAPEKLIHREGYLHKRNSVGFRTWRRRYVVLHGSELSWYDQATGAEMKGHINLAGCQQVVKDKRSFRWSVQDIQDASHKQKDFAAYSVGSMEKWMDAINQGIEFANAEPEVTAIASPIPAEDAAAVASHLNPIPEDSMDVQTFLSSLRLDHLLPQFEEKGYTDVQKMMEMGLQDDDLDHLGIDQPLARRCLKTACQSRYRDALSISMVGHAQLGDTIYCKIKSQYRYGRSIVYLSPDDIKTMHLDLRSANEAFNIDLPSLAPSKSNRASTFFKLGDKGKLINPNHQTPEGEYFTKLAAFLTADPKRKALLDIVLGTLELQS